MPSAPHRLRPSPAAIQYPVTSALAVFAGGLVGSGAREAVARAITGDPGGFPVDLLVVNLMGSFLLGWYLTRRERSVVTGPWSPPFWAIGVMGSFTTFSAFSHSVFLLIQAGRFGVAATYLAISLVGGLGIAQLGQRVGAGG